VRGPAIIHLIGYPGTGKRTIAAALVASVPRDDRRFVLVDNHLTGAPVLGVLDVGGAELVDDEVWRRVAEVRTVVHDVIRDLAPSGWSFVFTNVVTDASVEPSVDRLRSLAADRRSVYVPVVVDCDPVERRRRVVAPDRRVHRKWIDPDQVEAFVAAHELVRPEDPHRLELDVTHVPPEAAAATILEHLGHLSRHADRPIGA
jgi:hypothetical protein